MDGLLSFPDVRAFHSRQVLVIEPAEHDASILAPKPKAVGEDRRDIGLSRFVWDIVEVAFRVGIFVIDGWVNNPPLDTLDTRYGLYRSGSA